MKRWLPLGLLIVVLLGGTVFLFRALPQPQKPPLTTYYETTLQTFEQIKRSNSSYGAGVELASRGLFVEAAQKFEAALAEVDAKDRGIVEFSLANAYENAGSYEQAVRVYKTIASDSTRFTAPVRATAVQRMASMYEKNYDPSITRAIFDTDPYKYLFVKNNTSLSYRHLSEYAVSIHPIAFSQLSIADWYANRLYNQDLPTTTVAEYVQQVHDLVASADADIQKFRNDPSFEKELSSTLLRRSVIAWKMQQSRKDAALGDPEAGFKEVLVIDASNNLTLDLSARLYYANYLSQTYGKRRSDDIRSLLSPLRTATRNAAVLRYLSNVRNNRIFKNQFVKLATIDPDFKLVLLGLGWSEIDFKS